MTRIPIYQKTIGLLALGLLIVLLLDSCLMAVLFTGPQSANPGESITTQLRIKSGVSIEEGQPIAAHIYLSIDPTFDPEDKKLSTAVSFSALETDSYLDFMHTFTVPANISPGRYYLLAIVSENSTNAPAAVRIYDNGQNVFQHSIKINELSGNNQPDLVLSNIHIGNFSSNYYDIITVYPTNNPPFFLTVENRGTQATGATRLRCYLSEDDVFNSNEDLMILEENITTIASQDRREIAGNLDLDNAFLNANNYVFFVLDQENLTAESNETNNLAYRRVYVREYRPDIRLTYLQAPGLAQSGTPINVSGVVTGLSSGANTQLAVYLSLDQNISNDDQQLHDSSINGGGSFNKLVTLPSDIATGAYYLLANVNDQQAIPEYDYTNNYGSIRTFIIGNNFTDDLCEEVIAELDGPAAARGGIADQGGITETQEEKHPPFDLNLYPNPTSEYITIEMTIGDEPKAIDIQLMDMKGSVLRQLHLVEPEAGHFEQRINVSRLPAATYLLKISDGGFLQTKQFVVK